MHSDKVNESGYRLNDGSEQQNGSSLTNKPSEQQQVNAETMAEIGWWGGINCLFVKSITAFLASTRGGKSFLALFCRFEEKEK